MRFFSESKYNPRPSLSCWQVAHHTSLSWYLSCLAPIGQLKRMHQWKVSSLVFKLKFLLHIFCRQSRKEKFTKFKTSKMRKVQKKNFFRLILVRNNYKKFLYQTPVRKIKLELFCSQKVFTFEVDYDFLLYLYLQSARHIINCVSLVCFIFRANRETKRRIRMSDYFLIQF